MPSVDVEDTIAAIASATGGGLRGIIRLSGPDCLSCLEAAFDFPDPRPLRFVKRPTVLAAKMSLSENLKLPGSLLVWPTERSYTRQPSAEFHTFGSVPLLKLALAKFCRSGARLANPGEFTLRAFLSGRLDLTQAEAVLAVIDATAETQLTGALKQLAGGLSDPLINARDQLKFVLAELEAGLDFVEEDIEFISSAELNKRLSEIDQTISKIIEQISSRQLTTEGVRVALIGLPNAGKSSLFNRLVGAEKAIVTPISGTTTDFLIGQLEIEGMKFDLVDTAGLETMQETIGVSAAAQQQRELAESSSQLQMLCIDGSRELDDWQRSRIKDLPKTTIIVQTKSDLVADSLTNQKSPQFSAGQIAHWRSRNQFASVSSTQSAGIDELLAVLRERTISLVESETEIVGTTVFRALDSLRRAAESVQLAQEAAVNQAGDEIIAADIRAALDDLGLVVGTVYTDDILDIVFSRFCIGK